MGIGLAFLGVLALAAGFIGAFAVEELSAIRQMVWMNIGVVGAVLLGAGAIVEAVNKLKLTAREAAPDGSQKQDSCPHDFMGSPARCRFCGLDQPH